MSLLSDLRLAMRSLRRRPTFVLALVMTLALGVGVNTSIYALVDAILLRPLNVVELDRLVAVHQAGDARSSRMVTYSAYERLITDTGVLDGVAASVSTRLRSELSREEEAFPAVAFVTDSYFTVLGVEAAVGRTMVPGDPSVPGENPIVVLSWDFWHQRFGGDQAAIGSSVRVNGGPLTVVGVAPRAFRGTSLDIIPDMWIPLSMISALQVPNLSGPDGVDRRWPILQAFGRLAPGIDVRHATEVLPEMLADGLGPAGDGGGAPDFTVVPLGRSATAAVEGVDLRRWGRWALGIGAITLVLACLNIANLMIVRTDERRTELSVRSALGAGVGRLTQQLFAESLVLTLCAAVAGVGVAVVGTRFLSTLTLPGRIPLDALDLGIDLRALLFAFLIAATTAVLFGLVPALGVGRLRPRNVLYHRTGASHGRLRRAMLIGVQVALSLAFLVGTGLLVRSLGAGIATNLGFDPGNVAAVSVRTRTEGRHVGSMARYNAVVDQLEQAPGVLAVGAATHVPIAPATPRRFRAGPAPYGLYEEDPALLDGRGRDGVVMVGLNHVTGDYFEALDVPVLQGRPFTPDDGPEGERVVILNESAAHALFPGRSPIGLEVHGQLLSFAPYWFPYRVVGVVRDTRYRTLRENGFPFAFARMAQDEFTASTVTFVARTTRGRDAVGLLERTVATIAPDLIPSNRAEFKPRLVVDQIRTVLAPQRLAATLLGSFALLAVCVVAVGVYGTVAYSVTRRTPEIGIRIALGAQRGSILRLALSSTLAAVAAGAGVGLMLAVLAGRALRPLLYDVHPIDPTSFGAAVGVMALVSVAASLVPSWGATRTNPVEAIREL